MQVPFRGAWLGVALFLSGCASLPTDRGYGAAADAVAERTGTRPRWSFEVPDATPDAGLPGNPNGELARPEAIRLALLNNPRVRDSEAALGLSRAALESARRIGNPVFGYAELDSRDGGGEQITRSVSLGVTDLLLLGTRRRFANGELDRQTQLAVSELLQLATDVEVAWTDAVAQSQMSAVNESIADAAESSAALAQRFHDAGNIDRLQLEQARASATEARIEAARSRIASAEARTRLADLVGLESGEAWSVPAQLPEPAPFTLAADDVVGLALEQRPDLVAARHGVTLREDALGVTRRWRWLGSVEIGYEHESEVDGGTLRGPTLAIGLPIFDQGQGAVAEAQAALVAATARLDALALQTRNGARLGIERLSASYGVAERYRTQLVPQREAVVARTQEQVNFMLVGIFDLVTARRDQYAAYRGWVEAQRDYWVARAELRQLVGGRLPDDGDAAPTESPAQHVPQEPHANHAAQDPHASHATEDPHAGHTHGDKP